MEILEEEQELKINEIIDFKPKISMQHDKELSKMVNQEIKQCNYEMVFKTISVSQIDKMIPLHLQMQKVFFEIQAKYTDRMNSIMFPVNYIFIRLDCLNECTKGIDNFYYMYLLLTDCQIKLKRFIKAIQNDENLFKVQRNFEEFVQSRKKEMVIAFTSKLDQVNEWLKNIRLLNRQNV